MSLKTQMKRAVLLGCMTSQLVACASWRVESVAPAQVIARRHPKELRLRLFDGSRATVYGPAVQRDSLFAFLDDSDTRYAWALTEMQDVSTTHRDTGKWIMIGVLTVGLFAALAASMESMPAWNRTGPSGPNSW